MYMLGLMTLQLTLGPSMVDTGVEADWAKSDPTGPHPYQVAPSMARANEVSLKLK